MKKSITPEEYGKLPAYLHFCYRQKKPFKKYKLQPINDDNKISILYEVAKKGYSDFRIFSDCNVIVTVKTT